MCIDFRQRAEQNIPSVDITKTPMGSGHAREMLFMPLRHMERGWGEGRAREPAGRLCCARCAHSLETKDSRISIFSALATVQLFSLVELPPHTPSRGVLLQAGSSPLQIASSPTCLLWSLIHLSIYTVVNQD